MLKYLVLAIIGWLLLSLVLFLVSASIQSGSVPDSVSAALSPGGNMLTSPDTVLVIGTDQRPKGSKEPGAFAGGIRSDTMMLWRIGGGTSRRLSIPRDTMVPIPGYGVTKINAAYSYGGPALAIKTVEESHRGQDQPPHHRQPRQLPQVHRRHRRASPSRPGGSARTSAAASRTAASRCSCARARTTSRASRP